MTDAVRRAWHTLGTIRVRLTLWYLVLLALSLAGFSLFVYLSLARDLYAEVDRLLQDQAQELATILRAGNGADIQGALADVPAGTVAVVYDPASQRVLASHPPLPSDLAAALAQVPVDPTAPRFQTVSLPGDNRWRLVTLPVQQGSNVAWAVRVARSDRDVEAALRQLLVRMGLAVPLVLLLAVGGGLFLAGRALDPIDHITRAADQIGAADLSRRLRLGGRDEVARLAATFDRMLDRLERAFQQQRRFTADASHELRTPLAMLMSQIDVALERRRTVNEYEHVLRSVGEDVAALSQLLGALLTLARADAGQEPLDWEELELNELVAGVVSSMEPLARARGVQLTCARGPALGVRGDQTRLMQLLINLVDNGLKYTPAGGAVSVTVTSDDGHARIDVADTGVGISPEHLPRIFERFYRVDEARSREGGGAGLGLAISRWIAHAHGGEIEVASQRGRGTTFTVRLPVSRPTAEAATPTPGGGQSVSSLPFVYTAEGN